MVIRIVGQLRRVLWPASTLVLIGLIGIQNGWLQDVGEASTLDTTRHGDAPVELVAVFLGSSTCRFSRTPQVASDWNTAITILQRRAAAQGVGFRSIGIGVSPTVASGMEFLSRIGGFHEVNVGGDWHSVGVQRYVAEAHPGPDATPQVIILERHVSSTRLTVTSEKVLLRLPGAHALGRWIDAGAPLPVAAQESRRAYEATP